jgi:hypothetical protein
LAKYRALKEKQESFPMKSLLRSSIVALIVFAGYAALATDINKPHSNAAGPKPQCVPGMPSPNVTFCSTSN